VIATQNYRNFRFAVGRIFPANSQNQLKMRLSPTYDAKTLRPAERTSAPRIRAKNAFLRRRKYVDRENPRVFFIVCS
jgi:hypothetical protein